MPAFAPVDSPLDDEDVEPLTALLEEAADVAADEVELVCSWPELALPAVGAMTAPVDVVEVASDVVLAGIGSAAGVVVVDSVELVEGVYTSRHVSIVLENDGTRTSSTKDTGYIKGQHYEQRNPSMEREEEGE